VCGWPEGTFGLPMPKTGCPVGAVVDWETGKLLCRKIILRLDINTEDRMIFDKIMFK